MNELHKHIKWASQTQKSTYPLYACTKKKKKTGKTNLEVRIVIFLHGYLGAWESRRGVAGKNTEGVQGAGFLM